MEERQLLLMDHDLTSLERMGSALKGAGYDVTALNSDEWALLVMEKKHFDLVVADIFTGETTGIHFLQTVKRSSPDTMVILLTSRAELNAAVSALRLGADDYILKPCTPAELCDSVARCFERIDRKKKARLAVRKALDQKDKRFQSLVDMLEEGYFETDAEGNPSLVNDYFCQLLGHTREDLVSMKVPQFMEFRYADMFFAALLDTAKTRQSAKMLGMELIRKDGSRCFVDLLISPVPGVNGDTGGVRVVVRDISSQEKATDQLAYMAYHDALTGLKNRKAFFERIEEAMVYAERYKTQVALLFIDLDNFKKVNDQFGHLAGDTVLKEVAERLKKVIRRSDAIFRFGGDEFTVLLSGPGEPQPETAVKRIQEQVALPYSNIDKNIDFVRASIGVSVSSEACNDPIQLIYNADRAMYSAKWGGNRNSLHGAASPEVGHFDSRPDSPDEQPDQRPVSH